MLVIDAEGPADDDERHRSTLPDEVHLVIEVVSPESEDRDRKTKPSRYAEAGITHFWRVENNDGSPVVYVYELDPATHVYGLTGIHHERLTVSGPLPHSTSSSATCPGSGNRPPRSTGVVDEDPRAIRRSWAS